MRNFGDAGLGAQRGYVGRAIGKPLFDTSVSSRGP